MGSRAISSAVVTSTLAVTSVSDWSIFWPVTMITSSDASAACGAWAAAAPVNAAAQAETSIKVFMERSPFKKSGLSYRTQLRM